MSPPSRGMTCRDAGRIVSAYLESALASSDRERFEAHCGVCPKCRGDLARWRSLVRTLGDLENPRSGASRSEIDRLLQLFRDHPPHRLDRRPPRVPLGVIADRVAPGDHLAFVWESERELESAAGFVTEGAARGEACVLLGHAEANGRFEAAIGRAGADVASLRREDRLRFVSGRKTCDELLGELREQIVSAIDHGASLVRILGNLGWGRPGWPGDRELLRLEALVTEAVARLPAVVMCAYSLGDLGGQEVLSRGLACHPLCLRGGALQSNDLHVPAERILAELQRSAEGD